MFIDIKKIIILQVHFVAADVIFLEKTQNIWTAKTKFDGSDPYTIDFLC